MKIKSIVNPEFCIQREYPSQIRTFADKGKVRQCVVSRAAMKELPKKFLLSRENRGKLRITGMRKEQQKSM